MMHHKSDCICLLVYLFYSSSPKFWQQLLSQRRFCVPENKAKRKKPPSSLRAQNTHSPGSHQLIQSSVSHCYTHGQLKATGILINNVMHPGRRALNPGILAAACFPRDPRKDAVSFFLHSRIHASGLDAYGSELTFQHFVALHMFTFRFNTSSCLGCKNAEFPFRFLRPKKGR